MSSAIVAFWTRSITAREAKYNDRILLFLTPGRYVEAFRIFNNYGL